MTTFLSRCLRSHTEQHLQSHEAAPTLDMHRVLPRYKHSSKRLLLMDFEGTLWARPKPGAPADSADASLERALEVLRRFAADGRNDVWLLSGLPIEGVLTRIAKEVPRIGIVAENGCFIRPKTAPHRSSTGLSPLSGRRSGAELSPVNTAATMPGGWINMVATFNLTWKSSCIEILNYVRCGIHSLDLFIDQRHSSRSARRARSLRSVRRLLSGVSGPERRQRTVGIASGRCARLQRRRTISSTGSLCLLHICIV